MHPTGRDTIEQLREGLIRNLNLDFFDEEEIASILEDVESLDQRLRQRIFALCLGLSHASSSLVPGALKKIRKVVGLLPFRDLERWITHAFDLLDSHGIDAFLRFLSKTGPGDLRDFQSPETVRLAEIAPVLEAYLRGISGLDLKVAADTEAFTDTATVFLPPSIDRFPERGQNFLFYKLMAAQQWAQIAGNTLTPGESLIASFVGQGGGHPDIYTFFNSFHERDLAIDIYTILEAFRAEGILTEELPGLVRMAKGVREELFRDRQPLGAFSEKTALAEGLLQYYLCGTVKGDAGSVLADAVGEMEQLKGEDSPAATLGALRKIMEKASAMAGTYTGGVLANFPGRVRPEKVSRALRAGRLAERKRIEAVLMKLLELPGDESMLRGMNAGLSENEQPDPEQEYLLIRGMLIEIDKPLKELLEEKGGVPGGVLVKGSDVGGAKPVSLNGLFTEEEAVAGAAGGIKYDEWDFRRGGYRRNWCSLFEHDVHPGHEPFVELTLQRYGGYVTVLRKKFELLRREPKVLRRQYDGEDVDLDAMVEAFADLRAGLPPSGGLFTRLDRQERSIAVLFLLDMSGSTKGWVNQAEKESLVLMCEALEALGDRYAIYGFSGMTRMRCDFYRIKDFSEAYGEAVKRRIAGVSPKDYTRMGPPIRHSVSLLESAEARTRLLITLSDGKPEDWDTYKGEYGIEDTRRALIEARERGIHPFCITIDREAGSYLPHMYGETNYIFIDDVRKLPNRITEIYTRITTA